VLAALAEPEDPALDPALRGAVAEMAWAWAQAAGDVVERSAAAPAEAVAQLDHSGPLLLVAPDVPHLHPGLAPAALGDIAAGCAMSFAPGTEGRPYLLAFPSPTAPAVALLSAEDRHRDSLFAAAIGLGEIGMLRSERRLVTPDDALALAIDPLAPPVLRELASRL
jgi:hypothetical protein